MGDDNDDDARAGAEQHGGAGHHFPVGSRVEVLTDENLGGVYFTATVISSKLSRNHNRSRRKSKIPEQLYVKYHTVKASADRLQEFVDISSLRPPPPPPGLTNRFQANDVIDAFYNDGWCKGVVSRVVVDGNGERFTVILDKSIGDFAFEFRRSAIRPHWDWIDGVWAALPNLDGVEFGVGKQVEILIEGNSAWFPAVVVRGLENGGFLVRFNDKSGSVEVDYANVRPSPPLLKERRFGKWEKVEAFFDFRWWRGVITESRVKNRKYNVFIEEMNLQQVIDVFEVRAYMEWKDGKWFLPSSSTSNSNSNSEIAFASSLIKRRRRSDSKSNALKKNHKVEHLEVDKFVIEDEDPPNGLEPDCGWPFVKRSVHWKEIESMEVFRKIPQKPHFQPLTLSKESERQGMAIGYMITFSNVVERCCSLNIRDPKCVVEDLNPTLVKLEAHGFDLAMVRGCLMKFLEAKFEEEKLVNEGKDVKNQIEEHMYSKIRFDEDIRVMNGHIRRLQEHLELARISNMNEDQQIARLQTKLDRILQQISGVKCDFKALTASLL